MSRSASYLLHALLSWTNYKNNADNVFKKVLYIYVLFSFHVRIEAKVVIIRIFMGHPVTCIGHGVRWVG